MNRLILCLLAFGWSTAVAAQQTVTVSFERKGGAYVASYGPQELTGTEYTDYLVDTLPNDMVTVSLQGTGHQSFKIMPPGDGDAITPTMPQMPQVTFKSTGGIYRVRSFISSQTFIDNGKTMRYAMIFQIRGKRR